MSYKFGTQPARDEIARANLSIAAVADRTGIKYTHLYNVLIGRSRPSDLLCERLSALLGLPADKLFTEQALRDQTVSGRPMPRPASPVRRRTREQIAADQVFAGAQR